MDAVNIEQSFGFCKRDFTCNWLFSDSPLVDHFFIRKVVPAFWNCIVLANSIQAADKLPTVCGNSVVTLAMLLHVHPQNPQARQIKTIVEHLQKGGIIIYPTDTIYGLGCDIFQHKAIEQICRIKQVDPLKAQLSFICHDLSDLSTYTKQISTPVYRMLKQYLPGPYTFILPASKQVPKILKSKKDTIGLRVPDNEIARAIIRELGHPILSASLPGEMVEDYTDPELMHDHFHKLVDIVVDGGIGGMMPSTIVDCTDDEPVLIRQGLGEWNG